jgi:hypothetical protein
MLQEQVNIALQSLPDVDKLHPSPKGYQVWADNLRPILTELLGPQASTDHAPPPTGDPSSMVSSDRKTAESR